MGKASPQLDNAMIQMHWFISFQLYNVIVILLALFQKFNKYESGASDYAAQLGQFGRIACSFVRLLGTVSIHYSTRVRYS